MFILKCIVFVSILFADSCLTISSKSQNETARLLWDLSNFAIQSRQNYRRYPYPYSFKYPGNYPQYYQNYPISYYSQYAGSAHPYLQRPYYHPQKGNYPHHYIPQRPLAQNIRESFMDVLISIARNDDLQCVPKIICEVTSGTLSGRQQGADLPININMESLLGFFSSLNGLNSSPLIYFGKAALQGYTSKGNAGSCSYAYPECPSDPDRLVQYLNNHNGGFFRYFGGASPQNYHGKRRTENVKEKYVAEQRIQNNPVDYIGDGLREQKGIKFPVRDDDELPNFDQSKLKFPRGEDIFSNELKTSGNEFFLYKSQNSLKFPADEDVNYGEPPFRKPKELPYDISFYHQDNELDLQRPLPNHKATPMIFPDRTGTGDLRLDPEEFIDAEQPLRYEDDNVKITFNGFKNGRAEGKPFGSSGLGTSTHGEGGRGFLFPSR